MGISPCEFESRPGHQSQRELENFQLSLFFRLIGLSNNKAPRISDQSENPVGIENNHAKIVAKRNIKNGMSATPLN